MERHKPRTSINDDNVHVIGSKDSKSKFRSDIDAEKTALDAARYADEHNLWKDGKAKVPAQELLAIRLKLGSQHLLLMCIEENLIDILVYVLYNATPEN